jgi:SAM-dependent methyltransferase
VLNNLKSIAEEANERYIDPQKKMARLPNYYRWMYDYVTKYLTGTVVDLGCGSGLGIRHYADRVQQVFAIDFNADLLAQVNRHISGKPVVTIRADLVNEWDKLSDIKADAILMMDLVEHFKDDVQLLKNAADILNLKGNMVLKVPAQRSLYGEMDRASGHYRRYDLADIRNLAHKAGLQLRAIHPMNPLGGFMYRFRKDKKKNFSLTFSDFQLSLINALIPLISLLDYLPFLPAQSYIVVLVKMEEHRGSS